MSHSLSVFPFSLLSPLPQPDRSRWDTLRTWEELKWCWAVTELLFRPRVGCDVSCIPATSNCSSGFCLALCALNEEPAPCSPPFKSCPQSCVFKYLIWHAKSVCGSPDCLPNTLNLFCGEITLSGVVSLLKSVYTRVQVCRRTSSHIKQRWANRCAEEEKSEKK